MGLMGVSQRRIYHNLGDGGGLAGFASAVGFAIRRAPVYRHSFGPITFMIVYWVALAT